MPHLETLYLLWTNHHKGKAISLMMTTFHFAATMIHLLQSYSHFTDIQLSGDTTPEYSHL